MTFTPTHDWQPVPPGGVLPLGCQTRMNLEAQTTEARLMLEPHLDDARRFLELLDPDADCFTFQTFDDTSLKSRSIAKTMPGTLDACADPMRTLQAAGAGVFVTINATTGGRRKAVDVDRVRAVFADLDGAPFDPVLACDLEPHVVVESSPRKFHTYWLAEGVPLDQFSAIQKAIARRFGSDPKVCDLPRVMRLPGFWHQKGSPFLSRITQVNERMPYSVDELLAEFPPVATPQPGNGGDHDGDVQTMADLVRAVITGENYHDALRNLAWRHLARGMDPKDVERTLQGIMEASEPHDDRWQARYNDIPRAVETAQRKLASMGAGGDLTDDGLALEMGRDWEPHSRYCAEWGKWIFWHGDRWGADRTKLHLTRTRAWLRAKAAAIIQARPSMAKKAAALRDDAMIYAIDRLVTTNPELTCTSDDWDTDSMLLGGPMTVDLRTGEARAPTPRDFILKHAACAPSRESPELWLRCLATWTNRDLDLQAYLQRLCGYLLTGSVEEEVFAFAHGLGKNGKTKFVEAIKGVMGDYAVTIGAEVLMWSNHERHPTELAQLRGKRLAIASEVEKRRAWAENTHQADDRRRQDPRAVHAAGLLRVHAAVQAPGGRQQQAVAARRRRSHPKTPPPRPVQRHDPGSRSGPQARRKTPA